MFLCVMRTGLNRTAAANAEQSPVIPAQAGIQDLLTYKAELLSRHFRAGGNPGHCKNSAIHLHYGFLWVFCRIRHHFFDEE